MKTKTLKESIENYWILQTITTNENIKEKQFKSTTNITDKKNIDMASPRTIEERNRISYENISLNYMKMKINKTHRNKRLNNSQEEDARVNDLISLHSKLLK